jgi:glycosyltransferase involved in cell wall biosynthesis
LAARAPSAPVDEQHRWAEAQGPTVPALRAHVERERAGFDLWLFFSYLYATTHAVLDVVAEKAVLVPLAHDEWPLRLPFYESLFRSAARRVFVSEDERRLIERRFPGVGSEDPTIGVGIEPPPVDPARFRAASGIRDPFVLYVGRVDAAKGVEALVEDFLALRSLEDQPRKLVLAGPVAMAVPAHPDVIVLGPLDEQTKWDALAASHAVAVPSPFESLSLVALEALAVGAPLIVNGASSVLVGHCRAANAGLWYAGRAEFVEILRSDFLGARAALTRGGPRYVAELHAWPPVLAAYRALGESLVAR